MFVSCSKAFAEPRPRPGRPPGSGTRRLALLAVAACLVLGGACRTTADRPAIDAAALADARAALSRPLPGDLSALYDLRVPSSGALRLAVLERGGDGRLTVSEPFGGAVSVTSWAAGRPSRVFDLRDGCWRDAGKAAAGLGVRAMPLPQAVRLLGGRLPAAAADRVVDRPGVGFEVVGDGWSALVTVAPEPWRVTAVDELVPAGASGWRIRLRDHTVSVPGAVRIEGPDRGWAELELVRLEWGGGGLPDEPDLPPCGARPDEPS
jgi:hypothetical protein